MAQLDLGRYFSLFGNFGYSSSKFTFELGNGQNVNLNDVGVWLYGCAASRATAGGGSSRRSSGSASARSVSSRRCRGSRSPIASAGSGCEARSLASGLDEPLRPRLPHEELIQAIGLPEAAYGTQLERALELLIERLLADPRRRGRAIRSLRLEARLTGGGSWSADAVMRSASGSAERLRLALVPKLGLLASPATSLALRALELAPGEGVQPALDPDPAERRRERLAEAVRQVRAAAGRDAVLRVLEVDPGSRVPERWAALAPLNEGGR